MGGGTLPENFFRCKKFSEMPIFFSGPRPENKGGPKIEKKVVFWHKKCEKFRTRHPFFFSQKFFNPPMRPKRHFSNGNHSKNKNPQKSQNFAKLFFKKSRKKINKKSKKNRKKITIFFFLGACGASASFFFRRLRRLFFFFFFCKGKMNFLRRDYFF